MNYVTNDTMNAYLRTVQPMYDGILGEIQREALAAEVPIIPLETARLLSVLLTMQSMFWKSVPQSAFLPV